MCLAQQEFSQAAGAKEGGPLAAEDGRSRKERGKSMAEVVIAFIAVGLLGALVSGIVAGVIYQDKITNVEIRLEEIKMTLEELRLEKKNLPPPEHPLEAGNVVRFTQNKLIRDWWIGGKKKAKEEQ